MNIDHKHIHGVCINDFNTNNYMDGDGVKLQIMPDNSV